MYVPKRTPELTFIFSPKNAALKTGYGSVSQGSMRTARNCPRADGLGHAKHQVQKGMELWRLGQTEPVSDLGFEHVEKENVSFTEIPSCMLFRQKK